MSLYGFTFWCAYPQHSDLILVPGSERTTLDKARVLLSDRKANGQAFPGECVVKVQFIPTKAAK